MVDYSKRGPRQTFKHIKAAPGLAPPLTVGDLKIGKRGKPLAPRKRKAKLRNQPIVPKHAHVPTDERREMTEELAGYGLPAPMIARLLGIAESTLFAHYEEPLRLGEARATSAVAKGLYRKAMSGDTACMIFWLKARAKWSERVENVTIGPDGKPIDPRSPAPVFILKID